MGFYELKQSMTMNTTIDEIWNLSSSLKYLKKFTPDYRFFDITTKDLPEKISGYDYKLYGKTFIRNKGNVSNRNYSYKRNIKCKQ